MEPTLFAHPRSRNACTAAGATMAAVGAIFTLVSGADVISTHAWAIARGFGLLAASLALTVALVGAFYLLAMRFSRVVIPVLALAFFGSLFVLVVMLAVPGWVRILGFEANGMPGIGSVPLGLGCLAFGLGCVAVAWCRTPIVKLADGPSVVGKFNVAAVVALLLLFAPGFAASLPPKEDAGTAARARTSAPPVAGPTGG